MINQTHLLMRSRVMCLGGLEVAKGLLKSTKAEFRREGIFFFLQIFARDVLVMKKLEIEKTKPTFIICIN